MTFIFLRSLLALRSQFYYLKHTRSIRTTIKIDKDRFRLTLEVSNFAKDEIRIKARADCVTILGKQERELKDGVVIRQFVKKFRLPDGCDPKYMASTMSDTGILNFTAIRTACEKNEPCETLIPIKFYQEEKDDEDHGKSLIKKDPCDVYLPKPKSPKT